MPHPFDVSARGDPKRRTTRVAEIAARNDGVVSLAELRQVGLTDGQIKGWVKRGHLLPLYRGVFAVGHHKISRRGRLIAALRAAGPNAFLSHRTAAAVWGLRQISTTRIEVTVPGSQRRSRGPLKIYYAREAPDVTTRNGLRVSSVPRMLAELAPRETLHELDRLITQAVRKGMLDLEKMQHALARHRGRRGLAKLKAALDAYLPKPDRKSGLERDFDEFLAHHPEIPPPRRNVHIDGWEIDCYWPEQRLAVELDGRPYHIAVRDMEKDRIKDAKLLGLGIRTMRITDSRFEHDRRGVYADLLAALGIAALGIAVPGIAVPGNAYQR